MKGLIHIRRRINKENLLTTLVFVNIILAVALLVLLLALLPLDKREDIPEPPAAAEEEPAFIVDAELLMELAPRFRVSTELLELLFPGYLIFGDGDGDYIYQPLNYDLPMHDYAQDRFYYTEGRTYYEDNKYSGVLTGVDVSSWQKEIDWPAVAGDGIDFAMIRLAYRGYSEGLLYEDEYARANLAGATAAGLPVGAYVYSQAITEEEARQEAALAMEILQGYDITYPVVFDMEEVGEEGARADALTPAERTAIARAFAGAMAEAGYTPMIYGNVRWLAYRLELEQVLEYDVWFAQYYSYPLFPYAFTMWQYTDSGTVAGITGSVDLNLCFSPYGTD